MDEESISLMQQMEWLAKQSQDLYFTQYINVMKADFISGKLTKEYVASEIARTSKLYSKRMQQTAAVPQMQPVPPQPAAPQYSVAPPQPAAPQYSVAPPQPVATQHAASGNNAEFTIGAGVLSIVGILFLLVAFVLLGITYMNGLIKGMALYAISVVVLLISELLLARKLPKFAVAVSGLGISGLYVSTMVNYLYLQNFNCFVAMLIAILISLAAILLSRKRDSGTLKLISFLGCYICVFPTGFSFLDYESASDPSTAMLHFAVAVAILFIVNGMTLFLPTHKNREAINLTLMISNAVLSFCFAFTALIRLPEEKAVFIYLVVAVWMQALIFWGIDRILEKEAQKEQLSHSVSGWRTGYLAVFIPTAALLLLFYVLFSFFCELGVWTFASMGLLLLAMTCMTILFWKQKSKWIFYWLFVFTALPVFSALWHENAYWWGMGVLIAVFLTAKLLVRIPQLAVSELAITLWTGCMTVIYALQDDLTAAFCLLAAFTLSLLALNRWKVLYEEIYLVVAELFVLCTFRNELTPALMAAILVVGMLCFNYVEFFRDKNSKYINYVNLGLMGVLYLAAAFFKNGYSYAALLLLGITFCLLMFREQCGMNFKIKNIIFCLFLSYMVCIWDMPAAFLRSVFLMVIAIATVVTGFLIREKKLRITGLALTLAVCAKLVLYDFIGAATMEKMVLFFIVGFIALAISAIYIALEKKVE